MMLSMICIKQGSRTRSDRNPTRKRGRYHSTCASASGLAQTSLTLQITESFRITKLNVATKPLILQKMLA